MALASTVLNSRLPDDNVQALYEITVALSINAQSDLGETIDDFSDAAQLRSEPMVSGRLCHMT